tara:strand:+ start:2066 stop:6517 length:4452 start_codon:yes stop_codon:yes gene_type:complete
MAQNKFQHTFTKSKMNKDLDSRLLARDEYRDGQNIAVSRSEADDVGALENILGNEILSSLNIPNIDLDLTLGFGENIYKSFVSQIIGGYFNEENGKAYLFLTNFQDNSNDQVSVFAPVGTRCSIVLFDTKSNTTTNIVEGRFLNFSLNSPILDVVMIESLMFFTDNRNQPRMINVETAESNINYYNSEDHVSLAKYYPFKPIQLNSLFKVQNAGFILKTEGGAKTGTSIYDFIVIPSENNSATIAMLKDNIGVKGFMGAGTSETWNFTVTQVFETTTDIGNYTDVAYVYIDRNLSSARTPSTLADWGGSIGFFVGFLDTNSKDVSSPFNREPQSRLTIKSISTTEVKYGTKFINQIYEHGMSLGQQYQSIVPFSITNWNINNPADTRGFARITNPKLDPLRYYVIKDVNGDPKLATDKSIEIAELSSLFNGVYTLINPTTLPLSVNDILTIKWPNKDYNPNFVGDEAFLEDKFVRFAYRFKYDDGEYSLISPYTQEVFIPKLKGQFLKRIGRTRSTGSVLNNFIPAEQTAGENTIVNFMENEVNQVFLDIPCEFVFSEISEKLKVLEIDILYKGSMSSEIKVVETINVQDPLISNNNTKLFRYIYNSKEPIKNLDSKEQTRVYDNVPVRAKTLSTSGNRILMANFFDRHSSPANLSYFVGASRKFTPAETPSLIGVQDNSDNLPNKYSHISYPNHSLKQNRNYQVGLVFQDRYGRSSDVILSNVEEERITITSDASVTNSPFSSNPIEFGNSTLYHGYLGSVVQPLTPASILLASQVTRAGIVDWPGDSLKLLMTSTIPDEIPGVPGYPKLYKSPFLVINAISSQFDFTNISSGGQADNIEPGMEAEWVNDDGISYSGFVPFVLNGSVSNIVFLKKDNGASLAAGAYPDNNVAITFYKTGRPTGWYSYKVVVKQLEQEYYNVYLPSLLDGLPVIKPFTIEDPASPGTGGATFTINSNLVTMTAVTGVEYLTFPLLEGMKVITKPSNNTYYIQNIINYTTFELTSNAVATETNVGFTCSTPSSDGILNCTTLLTDNAQKVSAALNEASPVQVNFSTSDVELIPRYARSTTWTNISASPFFTNNKHANPSFPFKQRLKVRAVGNFENLFSNSSYNGLYEADTNPNAAVIENILDLGSDSETSKPTSEEESIPAMYETKPVTSALEIYYETSTAGLISDLNVLINNSLKIPTSFYDYNTTNIVRRVTINENLDYTSDTTIATIVLVDQLGIAFQYYNTQAAQINLKDITVSDAFYGNGTPIAGDGLVFEKFSETDANNRFNLKIKSNFPGYSSSIDDLNFITFNVNVKAKLTNQTIQSNGQLGVFVSHVIPLTVFINNIAPAKNINFINDSTTLYYIANINAIDPQPKNSAGASIVWDNDNTNSTTLTSATNGGNINNTFQESNTEELSFNLMVKYGSLPNFVNAKSVIGLGLYLSTSGLNQGSVILGVTGRSLITNQVINCQINAIDKLGRGLKTLISNFDISFT